MSPLFSLQPQKDIILTLDVGSARISAAIVELNPGFAPDVLFSVNHVVAVEENLSLAQLAHEVSRTLTIVLQRVASDGIDAIERAGYTQKKLDTVAVTISAPWVYAETRSITYEQGTPFTISPKMLDVLVEQEVEKVIQGKSTTKAVFSKDPDVFEVVDKNIMHILLNGYESHPAYTGEVEDLEASVFISVAPKKILETIRQHIDRTLGITDTFFNAFPVIASAVLRDMVSVDNSFIVLSVGGEMSESIIMQKGILEQTLSLPFGRNHMIRDVAALMSVSPKQAHSFLRLYAEGAGDTKTAAVIEQALGKVVMESMTVLEKNITEYPDSHVLPSQVFVIADEEVVAWMNRFTGVVKPSTMTISKHIFTVALLGENTFAPFCHFRSDAYRSPFLATEALFFNKMHTTQMQMDK